MRDRSFYLFDILQVQDLKGKIKIKKKWNLLTVLQTLRVGRLEPRYCWSERSCALIALQKKEVVWSSTLQALLSNFWSFGVIILSSSRPMELNVALKLAIKSPCTQGREEAAVCSVSYLYFLASDLFLSVLFGGERLRSVCTWTRLIFVVNHCKLLFSCTESSDVCLPILGGQTGGHVVLLWSRIIVSTEKHIFSVGSKRSCVCSLNSSEPFWIRTYIISSRPNINILAINEVILFDFTICRSEKLKIILLLLLVKITLFINILISTRLDSTLQELLLHLIIFFLLCLVLLMILAEKLLSDTVARVISFFFFL